MTIPFPSPAKWESDRVRAPEHKYHPHLISRLHMKGEEVEWDTSKRNRWR